MRFLLFFPLLFALAGVGGVQASDEAVRIGFLLNFSRFTEWPEQNLAPSAPITFCLAPGDAEMMVEFAALERQMIRNRPVKVIKVMRPADVIRCHVLYLPADLPSDLAPWLAIAEQASALTVSDRPDFTGEGGIIGLILVAGRYRFDVNLAQAKRENLYMGANLLKLARSVK